MGASGTMGALVSEALTQRGADVLRAHRGSGVDAQSGAGLAQAVVGSDVVVDCLNITTQSAAKAKAFFGTAATNIAGAAEQAGARVVCLSICNTADPAVNRRMGYYQGKAAQEAAYTQHLGERCTLVRTTQWFELAQTMTDQLSAGPVALMPHMVTAPLAASDGAAAIVDEVLEPSGRHAIEVRGPQEMDLVDVARAIRSAHGKGGWLIPIRFGGAALRNGALIPAHADVVTTTTLDQWLAASN